MSGYELFFWFNGALQLIRMLIIPILLLANPTYFRYVCRHRWLVFKACCLYGVPFLGIVHDSSKFSPDEYFGYAGYFYGPNSRDRTQTPDEKEAFRVAWLRHLHANKHHWEHWVLQDPAGVRAIEVPDAYRREMLADWTAMSWAKGEATCKNWYLKNGNRMLLHANTRAWLDRQLAIEPTNE